MNGRSQMLGGKNMIFSKEIKCKRFSSETLIGWKSGKTTYVPLWDQMGPEAVRHEREISNAGR